MGKFVDYYGVNAYSGKSIFAVRAAKKTLYIACQNHYVDGIIDESDDGLYAVCDYEPEGSFTIGEGCYRKIAKL